MRIGFKKRLVAFEVVWIGNLAPQVLGVGGIVLRFDEIILL